MGLFRDNEPIIQLVGGKPVGYLERWPTIWTQDYSEQIHQAVRAGLELGASEFQVRRSRIWTRDNREEIQLAVRAGLELGASKFQAWRSRIWTQDDREQIQLAVRAGLELGASEFQVRRSRVWTRDNREQIQLAVRAGIELAASGLQVRRFNHSATLPPSLLPLLRSDERLKAASNLWTKNLSPIKTFPLKRLLFGWKCNNYNRRQIAETLSSNRETSKTKQSTPLPLLLS